MPIHLLLRSLLTLALLAVPVRAAERHSALPADQVAELDAAIAAEMQKQRAVGLAIGVIAWNQVLYVKGYGFADPAKRIPVSVDTMFRWGLCSHTLTAVAALQLVEKGRLDLEADVRDYVPEFPYKGYRITPRHLLAHQSGIPAMNAKSNIVETELDTVVTRTFEDPIAALAKFKDSPLACKPGERVQISTFGYLLLSAVIQRAGQEKFAAQVQKRIAQPLGLKTLQLDYPSAEIPNRAIGFRLDEQQKIIPSILSDIGWKAGGGGFISSIQDFTTFTLALLTGGLLQEDASRKMIEPQKTTDGKQTGLGLGVWLGKGTGAGEGYVSFYQAGVEQKGRARMDVFPQNHSAVVVMANCEWVDPSPFRTLIYKTIYKK